MRNIIRFTEGDAEAVLGRPLTDAEYRRIVKAMDFSGMDDVFVEVVQACVESDTAED